MPFIRITLSSHFTSDKRGSTVRARSAEAQGVIEYMSNESGKKNTEEVYKEIPCIFLSSPVTRQAAVRQFRGFVFITLGGRSPLERVENLE